MLTAHQAVLIRRQLPGVSSVHVSADPDDPAGICYRQLRLDDETQIVLFGADTPRARRYRRRDDYSDRAELLPIEPDLRERLVRVFGSINFGDEV